MRSQIDGEGSPDDAHPLFHLHSHDWLPRRISGGGRRFLMPRDSAASSQALDVCRSDPSRTLSTALTLLSPARHSQKIPAARRQHIVRVEPLLGRRENAAKSPRRNAVATAAPTGSDNTADRFFRTFLRITNQLAGATVLATALIESRHFEHIHRQSYGLSYTHVRAEAHPRAAQKTAMYRSRRFFQLAAFGAIGRHTISFNAVKLVALWPLQGRRHQEPSH